MKTTSSLLRPQALVLLLLALMAFAPGARGQSGTPPELMSYQGFLSDAAGTPLGNSTPSNYDIIFRIFTASTGGTRVWTEKQTVTVDKGYFSILLGQGSLASEPNGTSFSGVFAGSSASDRFLSIAVVGLGTSGSDLVIEPRLRLLPSAYAFLAKNANGLANSTGTQVVTLSGNAVSIPNASSTLTVNGTISGTFSGNGAAITSLDASKITANTLSADRIPSLDASKVGSGQFATARIPNLDASKVTSGTLSIDRLDSDVARKSGATFTGGVFFDGGFSWKGAVAINPPGGMLALRDNPIRLRSEADPHHTLAHGGHHRNPSGFGIAEVDGPVLTGYGGGILGVKTAAAATANVPLLRWNSTGVDIFGGDSGSNAGDATGAYRKVQQLTIRARDMWGTWSGNRLALGMAHVSGEEFTGVIQSYVGGAADATTVGRLRVNPLGGETIFGGDLSVKGQIKATGQVIGNTSIPSDRNIKTGFKAVNDREILEKLSNLPVTTWAYTNATGITHMGPVAQDFKQAFNLGDDDTTIAVVDAQGVAFAAIKGLDGVVKEKDEEIQALKREVRELRSMVESIARQSAASRQ